MNRFRRGRNVSQWAGVQTGPMTVDVDALWANRNRDPVPHPVPPTVNAPAKYVSPLTAYAEYERNKTNACTPAAAAAETAVAERVHTEAAAAERASTPTAEAALICNSCNCANHGEPDANNPEIQPILLDSLPALKAAIESFEKRGDPIMVSVDPEPPKRGI